jgi:hypothetical protein
MKKYFPVVALGCICLQASGQLTITPGTQWINAGNPAIVLNNINFVNNGLLMPGNSVAKFTGNTNNTIGGGTVSTFHELEMAKTGAAKVLLSNSVYAGGKVKFSSGLLDLNQFNQTLAEIAFLENENETSRITGLTGGEVIITVPLNAPAGINPGKLGAVITDASNLGAVVIKRGHKAQSGMGMAGSIQRYYDISPANNAGLNATFRAYYFDAELNSQPENALEMFRSTDAGLTWTNQNFSIRNTTENYVENTGINSFSRWTVSSGAAPIIDLSNSQLFTTTQIIPGGSIDEVIVVRNVGNGPTIAPVVFTVTNYGPLTGLSAISNNNPSVTIGFTNYILDNSNWSVNSTASALTFTSNPGVVINPGTAKNLGIRILRAAGANGTVTHSSTISSGTGGGDIQIVNNSISNNILKN